MGDYFRRLPSDEILSGRNLEQQGDQQRQKVSASTIADTILASMFTILRIIRQNFFNKSANLSKFRFNIRQTGYLSLKSLFEELAATTGKIRVRYDTEPQTCCQSCSDAFS